MWAQCPHRWKTAYVDGHREFTESIHTLFGTSMHEVIQTFLHVMYTETAKKAESLDLDDLLRIRMKKNFESALKQNEKWNEMMSNKIGTRTHNIPSHNIREHHISNLRIT